MTATLEAAIGVDEIHMDDRGRAYYIATPEGVEVEVKPEGQGTAWDIHPHHRAGILLRIYVQGQEPAEGLDGGDTLEPEPVEQVEPVADRSEPDRVPPPRPDEKGLKFRYEKALRGRIGSGPGRLTHAEFVLLFMLLTYADENLRHAHPGNARLAADCGMTGKGAAGDAGKRAGVVASKGFAVVTRRGTNIGGNVSQEYRLKLPEWT